LGQYVMMDLALRTIGVTLTEFRAMSALQQSIAVATLQHKQQVNELKRKVS